MSDDYPDLFPEDKADLAWLASDTLQHAQRYADGRKLLEVNFSPSALRERRQRELVKAEEREAHLRSTGTTGDANLASPQVAQARGHLAGVTPEACLGEALVWAVNLPPELERAQAEALCLLWLALAYEEELPTWLSDASGDDEIVRALRGAVSRRLAHRLRPKLARALEMIRPYPRSAPRVVTVQDDAGTGTTDRSIPALSDKERAVLDLLLGLLPGRALTGKEILTGLEAQRILGTTQSDLTSRLIPKLRTFCTVDSRPSVGYSIPDDERERIRTKLAAGGQSGGTDAATGGQTS